MSGGLRGIEITRNMRQEVGTLVGFRLDERKLRLPKHIDDLTRVLNPSLGRSNAVNVGECKGGDDNHQHRGYQGAEHLPIKRSRQSTAEFFQVSPSHLQGLDCPLHRVSLRSTGLESVAVLLCEE